jgi:hypothetical protein
MASTKPKSTKSRLLQQNQVASAARLLERGARFAGNQFHNEETAGLVAAKVEVAGARCLESWSAGSK